MFRTKCMFEREKVLLNSGCFLVCGHIHLSWCCESVAECLVNGRLELLSGWKSLPGFCYAGHLAKAPQWELHTIVIRCRERNHLCFEQNCQNLPAKSEWRSTFIARPLLQRSLILTGDYHYGWHRIIESFRLEETMSYLL